MTVTDWRATPEAPHAEHIARLRALDRDATAVRGWQPTLFPGVLQSAAYAAAVLATLAPALPAEERTARAHARTERINALGAGPGRTAAFVVPAATLTRPVGGMHVLVDQLGYVLDLVALRPSVAVHVLADDEAHAGLAGGFVLYELGAEQAVLREDLAGTHLTREPDDVAAYRAAFADLRGRALPPAASLDLIEETKGRLCATLNRPPAG
ncbi:DUF5753 domain-containing protein [Streptomyces sp. NPDC002248]